MNPLCSWLPIYIVEVDTLVQTAGSANEPPAEQVEMLADMGFTNTQAKKALRETVSLFFQWSRLSC
jgi:hypothetical protein